MEIKRYRISVVDENEETHEVGEFTGTHAEAVRQADAWESESGHVTESLVLESLGAVALPA